LTAISSWATFSHAKSEKTAFTRRGDDNIPAFVHGSLRGMPPTEILQWLGGNRKSGTLEVEHDREVRRIHFRDGTIRSCGSDYAPTLLGQYLLSRGRISESELRAALAQQEGSGRNLGAILVDTGRLSADELERFFAAKVEESIYGIFDWDDGTFRFEPWAEPPAGTIETELSVEHVLLHGATRQDEMRRVREVIGNDEAVLERTQAVLPDAVVASPVSKRVVELVDGRRTVREIVLHAHASRFLVERLLSGLVRSAVLRVIDRKAPMVSQSDTALAPRAAIEAEARRRIDADDPETALKILEDASRTDTTDEALLPLRDEAEGACFTQLFGRVLGPRRVPVVVRQPAACTPEESFLLSLVDGKNDVRALIWLSPLRALVVVRSLKALVDRGAVVLRDP
jgi:hypothetical protein